MVWQRLASASNMNHTASFEVDSITDGDTANDWSRGQYLSFLIAICVSSSLSLGGSLTIVYRIYHDLGKMYHRILLMICIGDICISSSNMVHLFLAPATETTNPFVVGNQTTCAMVGFILNSAMVFLSIYNAFLAVNFLLQIKYKWTNHRIKQRIEKLVLVAAIFMSFSLPTLAVLWDVMSPELVSGYCLMKEYPHGCDEDDAVECVRGEDIGGLLAISAAGLIYMFGFTGFVCTVLLYCTVRQTINQSRRFDFTNDTTTKQKERLRLVSWQCTMYALAHLNTIFWPSLHQVLITVWSPFDLIGRPLPYVMCLVAFALFPLHGIFNLVVFMVPRYQQWRQALPQEPWTYVLRRAFSGGKPPTRPSSSNAVARTISKNINVSASQQSKNLPPIQPDDAR